MEKGIKARILVIAIPLVVLASSCGSDVLFNKAADMPGAVWKLGNVPVFSVPVNDTLGSYDISFTIRSGSDYPFRNIYIFVNTTSPDGRSLTDTLQYNLADEKGRRYGRGFGDIRELRLPYRMKVYFPRSGNYIVRVQHGMRSEDLRGIYDFGLRIDRAQP